MSGPNHIDVDNAKHSDRTYVGIVKLCWNNFRNNRRQKEFGNYARIIGSVTPVT